MPELWLGGFRCAAPVPVWCPFAKGNGYGARSAYPQRCSPRGPACPGALGGEIGVSHRPARPSKLISGHHKEGKRNMWRIRDTQGRELLLRRECTMEEDVLRFRD